MTPPPAPPPPDQLAAAVGIWRDHPTDPREFHAYAKSHVGQIASTILSAARRKIGSRRWSKEVVLLRDFFWHAIEPKIDTLQPAYVECLANRYAYLPVDRIREIRTFLTTEAGERLWLVSGIAGQDTGLCVALVLKPGIDRLRPEAWRTIGLKKPPYEPLSGY